MDHQVAKFLDSMQYLKFFYLSFGLEQSSICSFCFYKHDLIMFYFLGFFWEVGGLGG